MLKYTLGSVSPRFQLDARDVVAFLVDSRLIEAGHVQGRRVYRTGVWRNNDPPTTIVLFGDTFPITAARSPAFI